jgi:protein-tyrosine phosphatase
VDDHLAVLFVCTGNLNRSAIGAALFRRWADWYLPAPLASQISIASGGLSAPVGARVPAPTAAIAGRLGADLTRHRSVQLTESAVRSARLVLVASHDQVDGVLSLAPSALNSTLTIREAGRVAATLSATSEAGPPTSPAELQQRLAMLDRRRLTHSGGGSDDIIDPQGLTDEAYITMAQQEVPALATVASLLFGMPQPEISAYADAVKAPDLGELVRSAGRAGA